MAAVIRVKRRLEEEPLDGLLLNCKRAKTSTDKENDEPETPTILKFAGTQENPDEDIFKHIKNIPSKSEIEDTYKKHTVNITEKLRTQKLQDIKDSRFKIVNRFRSNISESTSDEASSQGCTIYDVEYDENQNNPSFANRALAEPKYVYDLYYTNSDDLGDIDFDAYVSVCPINSELVYGSLRDNGIAEHDSEDDSEDSNAENNWRNDYPDEDDMNSVTDEDMVEAVENIHLDGHNDLSTDDGEEYYVYGDDDQPYYDYVESTEKSITKQFARFKARYKKQMEMNNSSESDLYFGDIGQEDSD